MIVPSKAFRARNRGTPNRLICERPCASANWRCGRHAAAGWPVNGVERGWAATAPGFPRAPVPEAADHAAWRSITADSTRN